MEVELPLEALAGRAGDTHREGGQHRPHGARRRVGTEDEARRIVGICYGARDKRVKVAGGSNSPSAAAVASEPMVAAI